MIRDLLILPDGAELFSGAGAAVCIRSLRYSRQVSAAGELDFCCAPAAEISVQLVDKTGSFTIQPGTRLRHYRVDEEGNRLLMGIFYAEKPTRPGRYALEFTAYDAMILAEQDLTHWLLEQDWPMTIQTLLERVCQTCGLPLLECGLCNGGQQVLQFYQNVTGRQMIAWVAEANGMFACITPEGALTFISPAEAQRSIALTEQKSRKLSDAPCAPIDRVAICQEASDVGVLWPEEGEQTYTVTANPLLAGTPALLQDCARRLFTQLQGLTYTPWEAEVFADELELPWQPGQLVTVDTAQAQVLCAVFSMELEGNLARLKSWGQPYRDSAAGRYSRNTVKILQKQMTGVQIQVEGISAEVSRVEAEFDEETARVREDISALQVASDNISAQVSQVETTTQADLSLVQQSVQTLKKQVDMAVTPQQLELTISTLTENGVQKVQTRTGYTFDQNGLSITDSRSDIHNRIDYKGMYVSRGEDVILQADEQGVIARDVKVHNYLVVGEHARFEDYQSGRTACFWL